MKQREFRLTLLALVLGLGSSLALSWFLPDGPLSETWLAPDALKAALPPDARGPELFLSQQNDCHGLLSRDAAQNPQVELFRIDDNGSLHMLRRQKLKVSIKYPIYNAGFAKASSQLLVSHHGGVAIVSLADGLPLLQFSDTDKSYHYGWMEPGEPSRLRLLTRECKLDGQGIFDRRAVTVRSRVEWLTWEPNLVSEVLFEGPGDANVFPIPGDRLLVTVLDHYTKTGNLLVMERWTKRILKQWAVGQVAVDVRESYAVVNATKPVVGGSGPQEMLLDLNSLEVLPRRPDGGNRQRPAAAQFSLTNPETGREQFFGLRRVASRKNESLGSDLLHTLLKWQEWRNAEHTEILEWIPGQAEPALLGRVSGSTAHPVNTETGLLWMIVGDYYDANARLVCWNLFQPTRPWAAIVGGGLAVAIVISLIGTLINWWRGSPRPTPSTPTAAPGPLP